MYAGRIMEYGGQAVFRTPFHPYTLGLCNAFPDLADRGHELISIPGGPPSLFDPPAGCRFRQRSPFATARRAAETPALTAVAPGHVVACHYVDQAASFRERARDPATCRAALAVSQTHFLPCPHSEHQPLPASLHLSLHIRPLCPFNQPGVS